MMFLPLFDLDNKIKRIFWPYVTHTIIAINVIVFLYANVVSEADGVAAIAFLSFMPDGLPASAANLPLPEFLLPIYLGAITSLFVHYEFWHLVGNMLFLWVFGDNVEDAFGHWRFLAFYLICGFVACLVQDAMTVPGYIFYGASGATSGVVAAYLMLHPHVRLWVLVVMRIPLRVPAYAVISLWVAFQIYSAATDTTGEVAWFAHLAGLAVGAALTPFLKKPDVPLFDRGVRLQ